MAHCGQTRYAHKVIASRRLACVCFSLAIAACGASSQSATSGMPAAYSGGESAFARATALEYVPRGARWVVVAGSVSELAKQVPVAALLGARLGAAGPFSNLATLRSAGVDVAAPAGVVYPEARSETVVAFANVADPAKLVAFLKKHAGDLKDETSGRARLLTAAKHDRLALVLRGRVAFVVVAAGKSSRDRVAVRLANTRRAESFASAPRVRRTAGALTFGEHAGVYLSLSDLFADDQRALARLATRAADLKAKLKTVGNKPLERVLLRRELRLLRASHAEYLRDRERRRLLAGLGTLAVSGRIERRAARVTLAVAPAKGSPFAELLAPRAKALSLLRALRGFPLLAVAGHMRVGPLLALIEKLTGAQGVPFKQIKSTFNMLTKRSFDEDFVPLLSGEVGFAVREGANGRSGVDIVLGVRSADKAQALLVQLAADPRLAAFVVKSASGPRLRLPSAGQMVHVGLAGDALVATTDAGLLERIARGKSGAAGLSKHPQVRALLARPAHHAAVLLSGRLLGQLLAPQRHSRVRLRRWTERIPNIPRSKEYRDALVKLAALDKRIGAAEAEVERYEQQYYRRLGARFGDVVVVLRPGEDKRMTGYGGLFVPASLGQAIAAARVPAARDATHKQKVAQRDGLLRKRDELWRQLSDLRKADITRFINKK